MTLEDGIHRDASVLDPDLTDHSELTVPILRAGVLAQEFCRSVARANVEAVFERCFYLRSGDEFICVGKPAVGISALTLIGSIGRPSDFGARPGQSALVCDGYILIGNSIRLAVRQAELWRTPPWPGSPPPNRLLATCAELVRRTAIDAPEEGLARHISGMPETCGPQSTFARIARPRIARFERWLIGVLASGHAHTMTTEGAIEGLIGLGPGLTPSGDDFLVGALALLDALGERDAHTALASAMTNHLRALTTPLSACFLKVAAAGHVGEALHRAVSSVVTGDVDAAVLAAEKIGHSSGWDMMAGAITTLTIAARLKTWSSCLAFS